MIAYHGSTSYDVIRKFRRSKSGALGPGIYFSADPKSAEKYALEYGEGKLYTAELDVKNPLYVNSLSDPASEILSPALYKRRTAENGNYCHLVRATDLKKLKQKGYDAIIMKDEVMVFDPEQIYVIDVQTVKVR